MFTSAIVVVHLLIFTKVQTAVVRWPYKGNVRRSLVTRHCHSLELFCCFNGKRNEKECDQQLKHSATHMLNAHNDNNNNMIVWSMILCLIILTINYNVVIIVDFGCNRRHKSRTENLIYIKWSKWIYIFFFYDYLNAKIVNCHVGNCRPRHLNTCHRYNPRYALKMNSLIRVFVGASWDTFGVWATNTG